MSEQFYQIAVDAPLDKPLTYKLNVSRPVIGSVVTVPLGKRTARGVILNESKAPENTKFKIKEVEKIHLEFPQISAPLIKWMEWLSNYYQYPIGQIAQLFLPPLDKKEGKSRKTPVVPENVPPRFIHLNEEQKSVTENILSLPGFQSHLLWGVTGSGKTEVYLELLEKKLKSDEQGLVLVPEISLTPQLVRRFSERFGDQIAVMHSHLTDREKTNQWWSIVEGRKKILIGARSALFCPFQKLGLIIVDEEHEPSFKQDEKLKYHARDSAMVLAQTLDIPICLGSATPSLESWKNAQERKYHLHKLTQRYKGLELPSVEIVDLRELKKEEMEQLGLPHWLSPALYHKTKERLEKRQQVAFFMNRRGVANTVLCRQCGMVKMCPNCDISLTLHGKIHLNCHYCEYYENLSDRCDHCKLGEYSNLGVGTEKIENDLQRLFPEARLVRLDRDEIHSRETLTEAIEKIENHEVDIIIGTQMIAKGLDFQKLTLLGIILADIGFNIPDFRTGERNFQLLTQVSGRPGRHFERGEVIVQTYNPDHPSLVFAKKHDFLGFAEFELQQREELSYPPYSRMACVRIHGVKLDKVKNAAKKLGILSQTLVAKYPAFGEIRVLGPAAAAMPKLNNKYRYHMLLKSKSPAPLRSLIRELEKKSDELSGVKILFDIDPMNTM